VSPLPVGLATEEVAPNTYRFKETGEVFYTIQECTDQNGASARAAPTCSTGANTGPYYRSMSRPGAGSGAGLLNYWTASRAAVTLPTSVTVKRKSDGTNAETVYVILGGWGNNTDNSSATDAGLQCNLKQGSSACQWQIFLKSGSNTATSTSALRFTPGQTVNLTFQVYRRSATVVEASIVASANGQSVATQVAATGWNTSGFNNVMKRLTGIAAASGQTTVTTVGSSVSTTSWDSIQIGGTQGTYPALTTSFLNWYGYGNLQCFNPSSRVYLGDLSVWDAFEDVIILP
jgi:hypothetical protein